MEKFKIIVLLILLIGMGACDDKTLNLNSLTEPVDETFYTSEEELELALTGAYTSLRYLADYSVPQVVVMDNAASDIGVSRNGGHGLVELGAGIQSSSTAGYKSMYTFFYSGIARANLLLQNMARAKELITEKRYNEIKGQALFLRAYNYLFLTEMFGDVPYLDYVINSPSDALLPREKKSIIVDKILTDLQIASEYLPFTWSGKDLGRITKGAALGLRARIALYNGRYAEAALSAKAIIDNESAFGYKLHSDYKELFQSVESSPEIMLTLPFKYGYSTSQFTVAQGDRNVGSFSVMYPTQSMVDSYEAVDGKPIDESAVYDPHHPFENRDPRLKASIITPQSKWAGVIYESHPDSFVFRYENGKLGGTNKNCRTKNWPAAFCGYLWKKYTIEKDQILQQQWDEYDFALMRYAEILLIYAEAKIELNQIDASVLIAINRIRARAYGVDISAIGSYPAISTTNQSELRKVIRRERKVELANEGFRLFDIRRWRIAEKVMPVTIYGRILNPATANGVPQIDDDCFVSYSGIEAQYDKNIDSRFTNAFRIFNKSRDYLCPIPQQEIDTYKGLGGTLEQNPGY